LSKNILKPGLDIVDIEGYRLSSRSNPAKKNLKKGDYDRYADHHAQCHQDIAQDVHQQRSLIRPQVKK
jgi:hypothetical protein